jgi:hypothetical protein
MMQITDRIRELLDLYLEGKDDEFAEKSLEFVRDVMNDPRLCFEALLFGLTALADDAKDIGKFDRFHHWQVGFLLITLANLCLRRMAQKPSSQKV